MQDFCSKLHRSGLEVCVVVNCFCREKDRFSIAAKKKVFVTFHLGLSFLFSSDCSINSVRVKAGDMASSETTSSITLGP